MNVSSNEFNNKSAREKNIHIIEDLLNIKLQEKELSDYMLNPDKAMTPYIPSKYNYHYCTHCNGLNAFAAYNAPENIIHVCDWCNGEF